MCRKPKTSEADAIINRHSVMRVVHGLPLIYKLALHGGDKLLRQSDRCAGRTRNLNAAQASKESLRIQTVAKQDDVLACF